MERGCSQLSAPARLCVDTQQPVTPADTGRTANKVSANVCRLYLKNCRSHLIGRLTVV